MSEKLKGKESANKGNKYSQERIEQMRKISTGKKLSEETKRKISESNKGKTRIISKPSKKKGIPLSDELKTKISLVKVNSGKKRKSASSKYIWVSFDKETCKYKVAFNYLSKTIRIGYFINEEDAARAYDKKAIEIFGDAAILNFPI